MNYVGPFPLDIWRMIFRYFEHNFDLISLNSLSETCVKLNNIDREHRKTYVDEYARKCQTSVEFKKLCTKLGINVSRSDKRVDYVFILSIAEMLMLNPFEDAERLKLIDLINKLREINKLLEVKNRPLTLRKYLSFTIKRIYPIILSDEDEKKKTEEWLRRDLELIKIQIGGYYPDPILALFYFYFDRDIVNTIMQLQVDASWRFFQLSSK
jgi:hypothetical protein